MATRKRSRTANVQQLLRSDGALCLTFVNTARRQALESYDDLIAWGVETGALGAAEAPRLARAAAERPGVATGVARRGRTLRARLERIFLALAAGHQAAAADFNAMNAELRAALAARHLVQTTTGYRWAWAADPGDESQPESLRRDDLDRVLWPVLLSSADLLASGERFRVRQCASEDCGLLFVARGAASHRKWCGPACGERVRSLQHYRKKVKPKRQANLRRARQDAGVRMEIEAFDGPPEGEQA